MSKNSLFKIGDKIVYPLHGAGVIESIEEKEILGQTQKYYVMKMPMGDMKVMIPMDNVKGIGIREVISETEVDKVINVLHNDTTLMSTNWNKRYRENMDKIRSGNIFEVADVVRNLIVREKAKGLSTGEKRMLNSAKQILMSEIVLAKGIKQDDMEKILSDVVKKSVQDDIIEG